MVEAGVEIFLLGKYANEVDLGIYFQTTQQEKFYEQFSSVIACGLIPQKEAIKCLEVY